MAKRCDYKKYDDLVAWDLDAGCRKIVDQTTKGRRRLKKRLRKQARAKLKRLSARNTDNDVTLKE